jgi:anti-sigma regulatory factor (Ser/Thr protein kinase)
MDLRTVLPCDASSVGRARRLVRQELAPVADDEVIDAASLLVSELVTNAIVHARTDVGLYAALIGGIFRVEVTDGNPTMPTQRRTAALAGTGRGLQLIDQIATRWGVRASGAGKTIWFELAYAAG